MPAQMKSGTCKKCGASFQERIGDNFGTCEDCEEEEINSDGSYSWYYGDELGISDADPGL